MALLAACSSVNVNSPPPATVDPNSGLLTTAEGSTFRIPPEEFDYSGPGNFRWPDGRVQEGTFDNGRLQGMGSEQSPDGVTYTGQWRDGTRHGHGELVRANGERYVGDFADGLPQGKGTASSAAGVYRGTWNAGRFHGQGQFNASDGSVYQGQWHNGVRQGVGMERRVDGSSYDGEWLDDLPNGFGRLSQSGGAQFEGSWVNGQREGYGVLRQPSGTTYEGTWRNDQQHGFGRETRPDGSYYAGNWRNNQRHGKGSEVHLDGSSHEGIWQNGRIAGRGTRTNTSGISISGEWQDNQISAGTLTLPSGRTYRGALFTQAGRGIDRRLLAWLRDAAAEQDPHALYFLGHAYLDFEDPAPDPQTARVWLKRAAALGQADAQFRLAELIVEEDAPRGVTLLQAAAAQAHPQAHATLGEYHHLGRYLPQDFGTAIEHYEQAVALGSLGAANNLAWLLATCEDGDFADPARAVQLIRPLVLYLASWQHVDTLAAAHARLGDTELAARLQTEALNMAADLAGDAELVQMQARLDLYRAALPYVESSR